MLMVHVGNTRRGFFYCGWVQGRETGCGCVCLSVSLCTVCAFCMCESVPICMWACAFIRGRTDRADAPEMWETPLFHPSISIYYLSIFFYRSPYLQSVFSRPLIFSSLHIILGVLFCFVWGGGVDSYRNFMTCFFFQLSCSQRGWGIGVYQLGPHQ